MIAPWNVRDVYGCLNPSCRSRVLILRSSRVQVPHPRVPRCVCGGFLTPDAGVPGEPDPGLADLDQTGAAGADPGEAV